MAGEPIYPSTLRYRDRLDIANDDAVNYNKLYATNQGSTVWGRLYTDASVRQSSTRAIGTYREGETRTHYSFKNSGFDSNTCPAQYTHSTFKAGFYDYGTPIEEQHPITARRFKQKHPVDFMTQIRPATETMNQALRMMGTYATDQPHADRMGMFIPQGCPGGRPSYHPDVTTGSFGMAPTLPRRGMGQTLKDGRNLK